MQASSLYSQIFDNTAVQIALVILGLIIVQLFVRNYVATIIRRVVRSHNYSSPHEEKKREETLVTVLRTASAVVLWIVGMIVVLWQLHVNVGAILTGAGLVGILIGFGAQSTINNILSGLFIILENQYRVGDIVTLNETISGVVEGITVRITRLRDLDGALHIIPNGQINSVTNSSYGFANANIDFSVSSDADIAKVEKVINKVGAELAKDEQWRDRFIEPIMFYRVEKFGHMGTHIRALGKVQPGEQWDVAGEFRRRLKDAFDDAHIKAPYPQRVIHRAKE